VFKAIAPDGFVRWMAVRYGIRSREVDLRAVILASLAMVAAGKSSSAELTEI